jgi:serine/threonine-protein kinase
LSDETATPFGKYELLERLGVGGMAEIYRARYLAAPGVTKPVVIKRVLREYAEDASFVEMFVHEARISVGFNHGNIVQVFDFGQVNGEYYLAMELVDGQPLSRVLKKARALGLEWLPPPLAVNIAMELCKGLHHAHTRTDEKRRPLGVVHRDVSPDNILISYEGEVKITDFGIAKAALLGQPQTAAGVVKGKYRYFSPEQARLVPDLDARSDVYAVGVVLYLMVCGQLPAEGDDVSVMRRISKGQLTPPLELNPELDDELVDILGEAMATRREDRLPSAEALQLRLSQWGAVKTPLYPVHTLKHLMGLLYEPELTTMGRPPEFPPRLRQQMALWSRSQQKRRPRPKSSPQAASWPGTPASASRRAGAPASRDEAPAPRVGRRLSTPGQRVAQAPPVERLPKEDMEEDTESVGSMSLGFMDAETVPQEPASEPRVREDPYARVTGSLMKVPSYWYLVVGAVVLTVMGLKVYTWFWPPIPPLKIRSDPPGALVTVDKAFRGVTPVELEGISRKDSHTVEVGLPGRELWARRFAPGMLGEELNVTLEPVQPAPPPPPPSPPTPAPSEAHSRFGTEKLPARFTLQESWHAFSAVAHSLREPLNPKRTYSVWLTGSYPVKAPISEQDPGRGLNPEPIRSNQVHVFLEGAGVPVPERLFMLSSTPHTVSNAEHLFAFILVAPSSESIVEQDLTLHVRDNTSRKVVHRRMSAKEFMAPLAPEGRYTVRQLDPEVSYTLELQPREGILASPVAVLAVPQPGKPVEVSGQVSGDFRYALPPGRYTLWGARELWFALPRWQHEGREVELEVSLTANDQ